MSDPIEVDSTIWAPDIAPLYKKMSWRGKANFDAIMFTSFALAHAIKNARLSGYFASISVEIDDIPATRAPKFKIRFSE